MVFSLSLRCRECVRVGILSSTEVVLSAEHRRGNANVMSLPMIMYVLDEDITGRYSTT
jgi:hypothetical protein